MNLTVRECRTWQTARFTRLRRPLWPSIVAKVEQGWPTVPRAPFCPPPRRNFAAGSTGCGRNWRRAHLPSRFASEELPSAGRLWGRFGTHRFGPHISPKILMAWILHRRSLGLSIWSPWLPASPRTYWRSKCAKLPASYLSGSRAYSIRDTAACGWGQKTLKN